MESFDFKANLIRVAIVTFEKKTELEKGLTLSIGDIKASFFDVTKNKEPDSKQMFIVASTPLKYRPKVTKEKDLVVPQRERRACEEVIEMSANLVGVKERVKRQISSPEPCIAIQPLNQETALWLMDLRNILGERKGRIVDHNYELTLKDLADCANDRLDGVGLLAEVYGNSNSVGRFREYMRFFEKAFVRTRDHLVDCLFDFLSSDFSFSKEELKNWFVSLRDSATHADKRKTLVFESDVEPFLARMQLASFDVLLNKLEWNSPCSKRRDLWKPNVFHSGPSEVTITKGAPMSWSVTAMDMFGVFHMNLEGFLTKVPEGWWVGTDIGKANIGYDCTLNVREMPEEVVQEDTGSKEERACIAKN